MRRSVTLFGLPTVGLGLVLTGLIYGVLFVGVPYPDPTPEQRLSERFHLAVGKSVFLGGAAIFLMGLVAAPVVWFVTRPKPQPETTESEPE